ncbi:hypothetical protein K2173_026856 [Erythroxylum novogranatense]|uniref:Chlororespiratory reduction 4 n=1 Tax=Erythroxylum novogranatense TaxID=1862640 RepID=A0AAV8U057_9ROSI|nr:hypothetical protein K2173_026856 [Erythroxylum novogranatense]
MPQQLLKFLGSCKTANHLKQAHLQILVNGLQGHNFILPKLITVYSDFHSHNHAFQIFQKLENPNVVSYNTMIKCFIGKTHKHALLVYDQMKASRIAPNGFTYTLLLRCFEDVKDGTVVHCEIVKLGFGSSLFVSNTLLDFYASSGWNLRCALRMFEEMPKRDVVSWNTMIRAYMANGDTDLAIKLFDFMPERNIVSWNSIVSGSIKAGNMRLARFFFDKMLIRNEISWNSMILGYVKAGDVEKARYIFDQMPEKTVVSWTALITGYTNVGDLEFANYLFEKMPTKTVVTWNAMIAGCVQNHLFDQAFHIFHQMLTDGKCRPDQSTLISLLSACSHLGSLEHGKWIDSYMKKNNFELSNPIGNAMIDMYAKCGDVKNAKTVFNKMVNKCVITWTVIITGLAMNGHSKEALDIFNRMCLEGEKPDGIIFIAILSACTHGGFVEEGTRVFDQMVNLFHIEPQIEHYGCMVDLLGRSGRLEEAITFIQSMHLEPNAVIWASLLGSCKVHGNVDLFETVTRKILNNESPNPNYLTLISNMNASIGHWEQSSGLWMLMMQQRIEKLPGCSLIQIGQKVHEFMAKDTRHWQSKEIYVALCALNGQLKQICGNYEGCIF